jgi:hypothetical protein
MAVYVEIISARRVPGESGLEDGDEPIAVADIVIDGVVLLKGVTVSDDATPHAIPPCRGWGDRRPVIAWSPEVGAEVAAAILRALDGKLAVAS